ITEPGGRVTSMGYDVAGRRTRLTYPDGTEVAYSYDADGRVTSVVPTVTAADSFTAADGTSVDGNKWTSALTSGSVVTDQNRVKLAFTDVVGASAAITSTMPATSTQEASLRYTFDDTASAALLRVYLRFDG